MKVEGINITIHTDSKYVCDAVTKGWVFNWKTKGFKGKKNQDLWERYLQLHQQFKIEFHWIKGHAGHPENERCDLLAVAAAENGPWLTDEGFSTV